MVFCDIWWNCFASIPFNLIILTRSLSHTWCDIQGFRAMGLSVQYWPRWFQDFPAIWLAVPFGANEAHLGICTLPEKIFFVCEISCFRVKSSFPKGELVLWSLYGDKLSPCRNQQMNRKSNISLNNGTCGNTMVKPQIVRYRLIK